MCALRYAGALSHITNTPSDNHLRAAARPGYEVDVTVMDGTLIAHKKSTQTRRRRSFEISGQSEDFGDYLEPGCQ